MGQVRSRLAFLGKLVSENELKIQSIDRGAWQQQHSFSAYSEMEGL